jgi:hypothetical protein
VKIIKMELGAEEVHLMGPPPKLLERLNQIAGYTWDGTRKPFHSSYDKW